MASVVITEFMDEAAVARLAAAHDTLYAPELGERPDELRARVARADALVVRNRTRVDAVLLAAAPRLRVVGRLGVGLDNIDVAAARDRGVAVIAATGANARAVAEYVLAAAMLLLRRAHLATAAVAAGEWPRAALAEGCEIGGKTLGVVGFGAIGRTTAALARAAGMRVVACDPAFDRSSPVWREYDVRALPFDALLGGSDVVTLHMPLTAATAGLLDAATIARMKRGAMLINTSRGGIVDEAALAAALRSGDLGGAALDVFAHEPLAAGSALASCPNLILTPHVAGVTREANARVSALIADKLLAVLAADADACAR
jgi:(S)-sulfolactate dehydrogenase